MLLVLPLFHPVPIVVLGLVAVPSFAFATPLAAPSSVVESLSVLLGFPNIV